MALRVKGWNFLLHNFQIFLIDKFYVMRPMRLSIYGVCNESHRDVNYSWCCLPFSENERIAYCSTHVPPPHIILVACCWFFFRLLSTFHIFVRFTYCTQFISQVCYQRDDDKLRIFFPSRLFVTPIVFAVLVYKMRKHLVRNCLIFFCTNWCPFLS